MKRLFAVAFFAAFILAGCAAPAPDANATNEDPLAAFAQFTVADLEAAKADAAAHDDTAAVNCYGALEDFIVSFQEKPGGTVKGAFSAYQKLRNVRRGVQGGLPDSVHIACAPLVVDAQKVIIRLGLIGAGRVF